MPKITSKLYDIFTMTSEMKHTSENTSQLYIPTLKPPISTELLDLLKFAVQFSFQTRKSEFGLF